MESNLEFGFTEEILENVRRLAKEEKTVVEIARYIIQELDLCDKSFGHVAYGLNNAFNIGLAKAKVIGARNYFEYGTWNDEEIEKELGPAIKSVIGEN